MLNAKVLADSTSPCGARLTTFEVTIPRIVLAEMNTHRMFCLAGDSMLEFDLPKGQNGYWKRVYKLRLDKFVERWHEGASPRMNKGGAGYNRQPMQERLTGMRIRQLNENTGLIQTSHVLGCTVSGVKTVYEVNAGRFKIAGSVDHRVLTEAGWKTIGEITAADALVVRRSGKRGKDVLDPLRLKKIGGEWRSVWQRNVREARLVEFGGCQQCGSNAEPQMHHVIPVHQAPDLAFDAANVLLLCEKCHKSQHEVQGWQGGTYLYGDSVPVDSIHVRGEESTFDLEIAGEFPNFIANGVVVHNSRNSASSRAIPVEKMLARVEQDPFVPVYWGKNQRGMVAEQELTAAEQAKAENVWLVARHEAINNAKALLDIGVHKQITNRLLEPWMWQTIIFSATELENFYALRNHPMAQPEIQKPAALLLAAYEASKPMSLDSGEWHLPLVIGIDLFPTADGWMRTNPDGTSAHGDMSAQEWLYWARVSAGRCARVSYLTHDGKRDLGADTALCDGLVANGHMSPTEHPAVALDADEWNSWSYAQYLAWRDQRIPVGNFWGWKQLRKTLDHEHNFKLRG